jgi:hypothetical protein
LLEIKECMKGVVDQHNILKSNTQLDVNRFPVNYLTCTEFKSSDYPWMKEDAAPRVLPAKREYKPGGNEIARRNLEVAKRIHERSLSAEIGADNEDENDGFDDDDDEMEDLPPLAAKRARVD